MPPSQLPWQGCPARLHVNGRQSPKHRCLCAECWCQHFKHNLGNLNNNLAVAPANIDRPNPTFASFKGIELGSYSRARTQPLPPASS